MKTKWEPTKHGGFRRTGVAQEGSAGNGGAGESTAVTQRRSVVRVHPPVLILKWRERLGLDECPYLIRWRLETPIGSLRVHHWLGPDDDRAFHDHPWWFWTFVFWGGYVDKSPAGDEMLLAPAFRFRPALHRHTVVPLYSGAWTFLVTGPKVRDWGFWHNGVKFVKANKWFFTRGHHPCA